MLALLCAATIGCGVPATDGTGDRAATIERADTARADSARDPRSGDSPLLAANTSGSGQATTVAARPEPRSTAERIQAITVTDGLERPWSMVFLPDGSLLVAEKGGRIRPVSADGAIGKALRGVPKVSTRSQGGLLDLALSPNFAQDRLLYFSYAQGLKGGAARTVVARARLDGDRLSKRKTLYTQKPALSGGLHFGSRIVFGNDGMLYVTLGERNRRKSAQKLDGGLGKVIRLHPDGKVPDDNPFAKTKGAHRPVYSYGHRNPQGAALHPITGELWVAEHGPQGGDEVNIIQAGANYGWPNITYGREYGSGEIIGEGTQAPDVIHPVFYWVPFSIGPSSLAFYTGDKVPALTGSLLVGALGGRALIRLAITDDKVTGEERLFESLDERIRDVAQGPDGHPYLLTDSGKLLRIEAR